MISVVFSSQFHQHNLSCPFHTSCLLHCILFLTSLHTPLGVDHPTKFPHAHTIMKHAYQIVIAIDAFDKKGNPVSLETFNFEPKDVMKIISTDDYLEFLAYTLEYKAIIIEQLSEERERKFLAEWNNNPPYTPEGYGVIVKVNIIRDLKGFGSRHMTTEAKKVLGEGLKIGVI